jgi:hypothetical protein
MELDLITRWLLMHHVEVSNTWYDGAWSHFRELTIDGRSGVVIVRQAHHSRTPMLIPLGTT